LINKSGSKVQEEAVITNPSPTVDIEDEDCEACKL